ncbi:hypothetical protein DPQ22_02795 [Candidatus Tokpelaia sp.]|nr:hypothetical protein DPQ22_02795 [Candidatus Tokpelaia sp.]
MNGAGMALAPYPVEAVEEAVMRFLRAEVPRKNRGFAPSVEEISAEVKEVAASQRAAAARAVRPQKLPPAKPKEKKVLTRKELEALLDGLDLKMQGPMRRLFDSLNAGKEREKENGTGE